MTTLQKKQKIGTKLGTENKKRVPKKSDISIFTYFLPLFPPIWYLFRTSFVVDYQHFPLFTSFFTIFEMESEKTPFYIQKEQYV